MAESTNSVGFSDLKVEVGRFLGYGSDSAAWTVAQAAHIESVVHSGVRRVYFPPLVKGAEAYAGHVWTWLNVHTTLPTVAQDYDYDMPDDFGRLIGDVKFGNDTHLRPIKEISVGDILNLRARGVSESSPQYVAIRKKAFTGATGTRYEALFFPTPDSAYTLHYAYEAYTGKLTTDYPYPLGGAELTELYIESCLAVAEQKTGDNFGVHTELFADLLIDRIKRDLSRGPKYFGQMGHKGTFTDHQSCRREVADGSVFYNGTEIE
jgi:hypothetical protein